MSWRTCVILNSLTHIWVGELIIIGSVMACRLVDAKPLCEPMLEYCWLYPYEQALMKYYSKFIHFHSRKCMWKCRVRNGGHFVSASMCERNTIQSSQMWTYWLRNLSDIYCIPFIMVPLFFSHHFVCMICLLSTALCLPWYNWNWFWNRLQTFLQPCEFYTDSLDAIILYKHIFFSLLHI